MFHTPAHKSTTAAQVAIRPQPVLSAKTQAAIDAYGREACLRAARLHSVDGEGGSTVGIYLGLRTNQADAAINAGVEMLLAAGVCSACAGDGWSRNFRGTCASCSGSGKARALLAA